MELLDIYLNSQIHNRITLDRNANMLSHCYLISCVDEMKIESFAYFIAKEICCLSEEKPCNHCINCQKIEHGNMVDLCIFPKDNSTLVVDDINEIVSDCYITPIENNYKIYILKNFDLCTIQAQNKILKTLEEPPKNVIFILTCTNENSILQTIISRSKKLVEPLLEVGSVEKFLADKKVNNARLISEMSDGNLTTAMKLAENTQALDIVNLVFDTLLNLKSSSDILKYSSKILALKKDIPFFLDTFISVLRDISVSKSADLINFKDKSKDLQMLSNIYSKEAIFNIVEKVNNIYNKIEFNCNMTGLIDQMLLDILEVKFLCQK